MRRGRAGRWFAKYIQKSIFEDMSPATAPNEGSDNEGDDDKKLKKRKRRY